MIFFAGSLALNGGSTFLIRMAREYSLRGIPVAVIVVNDVRDAGIESEIIKHAKVFYMENFIKNSYKKLSHSQLAVFFPSCEKTVKDIVSIYGNNIHVMGVFGLILAMKWHHVFNDLRVTVGIYHQNEFMYGSKQWFSIYVQNIFKKIPASNVIFFNEFNKIKYAKFFNKSYDDSLVLPIGINLPMSCTDAITYEAGRIVSVGNLVDFKTYNEHIIKIVSELVKDHPEIQYDIYGEGPNRSHLEQLVANLKMQQVVHFHGAIEYKDFPEKVKNAMLFVGSGTALIEAAALKVPSMVGVESIKEPFTYGYFWQIEGYSYNEMIEGRPLYSMKELTSQLMHASNSQLSEIGALCEKKSKIFSINNTVDGFVDVNYSVNPNFNGIGFFNGIFLIVCFLWMSGLDFIGFDKVFRSRRNQSS